VRSIPLYSPLCHSSLFLFFKPEVPLSREREKEREREREKRKKERDVERETENISLSWPSKQQI